MAEFLDEDDLKDLNEGDPEVEDSYEVTDDDPPAVDAPPDEENQNDGKDVS